MVSKRPDRKLGPGHDTFWDWCGRGELRLPRCTACGTLAWPVVQNCEACGHDAFDWERMSGRAKIVSWCTFERDYYQGALPLPWETILVELEEGPLFIANPKALTWRDMRMGMPVRLAFLACHDEAGDFQLPIFERA